MTSSRTRESRIEEKSSQRETDDELAATSSNSIITSLSNDVDIIVDTSDDINVTKAQISHRRMRSNDQKQYESRKRANRSRTSKKQICNHYDFLQF